MQAAGIKLNKSAGRHTAKRKPHKTVLDRVGAGLGYRGWRRVTVLWGAVPRSEVIRGVGCPLAGGGWAKVWSW